MNMGRKDLSGINIIKRFSSLLFVLLFSISLNSFSQNCEALFEPEFYGFDSIGNSQFILHSESITDTNDYINTIYWFADSGFESFDTLAFITITESTAVCMDITTNLGCTSTFCDTIFPYNNCDAFYSQPTEVNQGFPALFTDSSTISNGEDTLFLDSSFASWEWEVSNIGSNYSYDQNLEYTFFESYAEVCLTISTGNCQSTYCDSIDVIADNSCNASFTFPNTVTVGDSVTFISTSSQGVADDITSYIWAYPNGTISSHDSLVLSFDSIGTFTISLSIETSTGCVSGYTDSITVVPTDCQANFEYDLSYDSTQNAMQCSFTNTSDYTNGTLFTWDFDDGNFSNDLNPEHYYQNPGTYLVCLYLETSDSCTSVFCDSVVISPQSSLISGRVYAKNNLLPYGIVQYFRKTSSNKYLLSKVSEIRQGQYADSLPQDTYLLLFIPMFNPDYIYTPVYFPTYYGGSSNWQQAVEVTEQTQLQDTYLNYKENETVGVNNAQGVVYVGNYYNFEYDEYSDSWYPAIEQQTNSENATNQIVYLLSSQTEKLDWALSDYFGEFKFTNLKDGNYFLEVQKPGFVSEQAEISLSENNSQVSDIVFYINEQEVVLNFDSPTKEKDFEIYPVPVKDFLSINSGDIQITKITVADISGSIVLNKEITHHVKIYRINTKNLIPGTYILTIYGIEQNHSQLILKQ